ncbi:methyltransferase, FxLD system [Streptomyces sp. ME19-01-6]|uniref:methyltransferase, FxLD system n=1 Tax=Streptomyces sp. ME19-01-6 TaxID=3028686 RepID=UPI0029B4A0AF|nr:methyltransferase, FxLD system [Streptomyces sp. ME19-01-6]MDX3224723.1 methyltransferase, FxLD system [Streptomyces sp. ME19-01-6]
MNTTPSPATPEALRTRMVDLITSSGFASGRMVQEAMSRVPRHEFLPAADVEIAYANQAVITKRAADGAALSCASQPTVVAMMLVQLQVQEGDRILEIGAGTGYNAALLAQLTGPRGQVTTVDIDPEVTDQARKALDATGNHAVHVITRDGVLGAPERAPYDRIILTVGAWDLPRAWWDQLAPGGRLVVPLRWRGQTRSVAFVRDGDTLRSDSVELCGFVPLVGQKGELHGPISPAGDVTLYWDADQPINPAALMATLDQAKTIRWSGQTVVSNESFDGVWLRMTAAEPGTCRLKAAPTAVSSGLCTPAIAAQSPALVERDSLAYLTQRRLAETEPRWELGAIGHGPAGEDLAERLCKQIRTWNLARTSRPVITARLAGTPDNRLAEGQAIDKDAVRLVVSCTTGRQKTVGG